MVYGYFCKNDIPWSEADFAACHSLKLTQKSI